MNRRDRRDRRAAQALCAQCPVIAACAALIDQVPARERSGTFAGRSYRFRSKDNQTTPSKEAAA